jgi:hypothetical protein
LTKKVFFIKKELHLAVDQHLAAAAVVADEGGGDELVGAAEVRQDLGARVVPQRQTQVPDARAGVMVLK